MVMSVLTNISSLNAQNNLAKSQSKLSTAIARLSSGMRINSAKDDAAGLAIATRFTTQINGLNQAVRNANDGISLSQTTESALDEVTNNLQRIRELAVQSANATNSENDRAALDAEVQQRLAEVTRISQQTTFNGRHVLDGSFGTAAFQVGANVGETISVDLTKGTRADQIGQVAKASSGDLSTAIASTDGLTLKAGDLTISDGTTTKDIVGNFTDIASLAAAINGAGVTGVTAADDGSGELKLTNSSANTITVTGAQHDALFGAGATSLADGSGTPTTVTSTGTAVSDALAATAGYDLTDFSIKVGDGDAVSFAGVHVDDAKGLADAINAKGITGLSAYVDSNNKLQLDSQDTLTIAGATDTAALGMTASTYAVTNGSLDGVDVKTVDGANDTIARIDSALSSISSVRSDLGAVQNRFDSTIANLQTISQNLDSSRSQIQDADFAAETANMSSANILQQAGVSVLAQANSTTQSVLKLLQ